MNEPEASALNRGGVQHALDTVQRLCERYELTSLRPFLSICRTFADEGTLSIALVGRFKAGKSSFLNHLLKKEILPVGVVPVTTVVTEIEYGPKERGVVRFSDGHTEEVGLDQVCEFVSEKKNPAIRKAVNRVIIETPSLEPFGGIRFVDTPGLDSALAHNTSSAREWLPNIGLALLAVAADAPLSQQDVWRQLLFPFGDF